MIIVSSCLAGINCRWDGEARPPCPKVVRLLKEGKAILVCPEQLGGLPTPRDPTEQQGTKFITKTGKDVTANFERGAEQALKITQLVGCQEAVLKSKSPSCGSGQVYDGSFSGTLTNGDGAFAARLKANGIKVLTEKEFQN